MTGKIDKYEWIDLGSSYVPSEISCAGMTQPLSLSSIFPVTSLTSDFPPHFITSLPSNFPSTPPPPPRCYLPFIASLLLSLSTIHHPLTLLLSLSIPLPLHPSPTLPLPLPLSPSLPPPVLWGQLEHCTEITTARLANFSVYAEGLLAHHKKGHFRIPHIPSDVQGNAHIFFLILPSKKMRLFYETELKRRGVSAFSHYVPLHR